jgi:multiple sugar transport system permease protein
MQRGRVPSRLRRNLPGYFFLAPWLVGVFGLTLGPALISLYLSFTRFDMMGSPRWIGVDNYVHLATGDPRFWQALQVTSLYVVLSVSLKLLFALTVAMVLNRGMRGLSVYRAIFYLPSLLGGSVAVAILWREIFASGGLITRLLALAGIHATGLISSPDTALFTLVILSVWQFGSPMIIFLAGLRQIPLELYEAASLDGATKWQQFVCVTLPMLTPVIFFNLVVQTVDAFKAFTPAYIISDGTGGPVDSTLFYTLYLFQQAFTSFRMGYASALAWVLVVLIACFTARAFLSSRYWVHYNE